MSSHWLVGWALVLVACPGARAQEKPWTFARGEPMPERNALFELSKGWVGGDGVYSVELSHKRTLWLFSDTFVGTVKDNKRVDCQMVNNSVALQDGKGSDAKLTFVVGGTSDRPLSLIKPADGKGWYWLQAGTFSDERLHLFLAQIEKTDDKSVFGFRQIGQWLGVVSNPNDEPTKWKVEQTRVPYTVFTAKRHLSYGAAALPDGDYLYVYGSDEDRKPGGPERYLTVARVPLKSVAKFDTWRFYGKGEWHADHEKAERLTNKMATEFSVSYLPARKCFVLVYTENGLSPRILARTAEKPWGPWSEAQLIYECPEMAKDKKVFSYAAKAHPSQAGRDELVVSYVVNSFDFWQVFKDASLYWPRFIRVKVK